MTMETMTTTTTTTMRCQDSAGSAWCHCSSTDLGGGGGGGGGGAQDFLGLFGDRHSSSDDLFELVWRGAGSGGGGMEAGQPSCKPLSSRRPVAVVLVPETERLAVAPPPPTPPAAPPSEAEMASWLVPIVSGGGGGDAGAVVAGGRRAWVDDDQMLPTSEKESSSGHKLQEKRKASSPTGGRRSQHHAQAHSLTEKRRRRKIKEKLKTLQQLVPGLCHNSNQASTLDQTIRYMKSLQHHVQAMSSFRCGVKPTSVAAVCPVVKQAPCLGCCWWQGGTTPVQGQGWLLGGIPFCAP